MNIPQNGFFLLKTALPMAATILLSACNGAPVPASSAVVSSLPAPSSQAVASSEPLSSAVAVSSLVSSSLAVSSVASSLSVGVIASESSAAPVMSSSSVATSSSAVSSSSVFVASSSSLIAVSSSASQVSSAASSSVAPVGCEVSDTRLDLNDVSFLFPLPKSDEELELLLDFDSPGVGGQLASKAQQDGMLEVLLTADARDGIPQMRILGVRIEPCAKGHEGKECTKELRLVAQPVGKPGDTYKAPLRPSKDSALVFTETTAMNYFGHDQVLHFIYELSDENFALLAEDLRRLKTVAKRETSCVPMNIHPVMARQGLGGEYATLLKDIVQRYAGEANLDRAAFTAARSATFWFFAMMTRERGFTFSQSIVRSPQFVINPGITHDDHVVTNGGIAPDSFLGTLMKIEQQTGTEQVLFNRAMRETLVIDNPHLSNPETIGCVECHSAQRLRERSIDDPRFTIDPSIWQDLYKNPRYDLSAVVNDGHSIGSLRMFGYMNEDAHIAIRVINDSAESAQMLNDMN
jgi:hypothetical protein